jgi:hypothetical protein
MLIGCDLHSSTGQNAKFTVVNCDILDRYSKIYVILVFVLILLSYVASRSNEGLLVDIFQISKPYYCSQAHEQ